MKCSNGCDKEAEKKVPITGQMVCSMCWDNGDYFNIIKALKVFVAIKLFGYKVITTTYRDKPDGAVWFWLSCNPDQQKTFNFEDINWNTFDSLLLLPNVQRIKGKLVSKGVEFYTKYTPNQKYKNYKWNASIKYKHGGAAGFGKTEEETLCRAIHIFYELGGRFE